MNKFSIVGKTGTDITSRVGKVIVYSQIDYPCGGGIGGISKKWE